MNGLDCFLVFFFLFQVLSGFLQGFFWGLIGLSCFAAAVFAALRLTPPLLQALAPFVSLPYDSFGILLFVLIALLTNALLALLFLQLRWEPGRGWVTKSLGALVGAFWGSLGFLLIPWLYASLIGPLPVDARLSHYGLVFARGPMDSLSERLPKRPLPQLTILPSGCNRTFFVDSRPSGGGEIKPLTPSPNEWEMLAILNRERHRKGLPSLQWDGRLAAVARAHTRDMLARNYFAHRDPVGWDVGDRLHKAKLPFALAGENLAFAPSLPKAIEGVLASPEHRENLLRPEFSRCGLGIVELPLRTRFDPCQGARPSQGYGGYYLVTQIFAH
ncbi:MAG: CAP domain-containing protein [Bacteroidota bacterium]